MSGPSWGPAKNRGAFDFECWKWINPRCCVLMWGPPGARSSEFFEDETKKNPKTVAPRVLRAMLAIAKAGGPSEWWAHNGGKYDNAFILQAAVDMGWEVSGHVAAGRLVVMKLKAKGEPTLTFYDSQAVVPSSLKNAAKSFKLNAQKLFTADDYSVDVRRWSRKRLREGCEADCAAVLELLEVVETLLEGYGGELRATFSSAALTVVESRVELPDMRPHRAMNEIARRAYAGGRVEVFHHDPGGWLAEWDVTSSYPWSMTQKLPFKLLGMAGGPKAVMKVLRGEVADGVVRARVKVPRCEVPLLPFMPEEGGVFFPTGEWTAWFQAAELREALALGYEVKPLEAVAFTVEQPFIEYVEELFQRKAMSQGAERELMKLLLNGSYGKFAQRPERENLVVYSTEEEAEEFALKARENTVRFLSRSDLRFISVAVERWGKRTHYALAGAITAHSRILLHRFLRRAERLAYCDTDSIHAAQQSDLPVDSLLGGLKLELKKMKARYWAPKIYEIHHPRPYCEGDDGEDCGGDHFACKGFPVTAAAFANVVAGKEVRRERFRLAKGQMKARGQPGLDVQIRRWMGGSTKRRALDDGSTVPWTVEELKAGKHSALDAEGFPLARSPIAKWRR